MTRIPLDGWQWQYVSDAPFVYQTDNSAPCLAELWLVVILVLVALVIGIVLLRRFGLRT